MKNIIFILYAILLLGTANHINAQSNSIDQFTVKVDGLGCAYCAFGLEKKFNELDAIQSIDINLEKGILQFDYPKVHELSIGNVEKQVEAAGYTAVYVKVERANGKMEKSNSNAKSTELKTFQFSVAGNCGMCKKRIEAAAKKIDGVKEAVWDEDNQVVSLKVLPGVNQRSIEKAIAKAGHDTENVAAKDKVYRRLHACCKYDRKNK